MARQPGGSKSTFYREWRKSREGELPDVVLDLSIPGVIKRSELAQVLASERAVHEEEHERLHAAKRLIRPIYDDLRAAGKSDLRARREAAGLSVDDLCAATGIPQAHLIQIESETRTATEEQRTRITAAIQSGSKGEG